MDYCGKKFLSQRTDETGSIAATINYDTEDERQSVYAEIFGRKDKHSVDATVQIRDCYKQVELTFYASTPEDIRDRREKIDLLINELSQFRAAYQTISEQALQDWAEVDAKEKETTHT